jgi:hypothetical protein
MSLLQNKIPHKATLVNSITDILAIDKDAVYRRLRGDVNFSFTEMSIIARTMGISLDTIVGTENPQIKSAQINISKQVHSTETDYKMFEEHVGLLKFIKDEPDTKIIEAGNIFPHYLFQDYEYLTRFYLFKWNQASGYGDACPFHEITIPERLRVFQKEVCFYARHVKSTVYVLDHLILHRLVTNIKYFLKVRLIREEDVSLIKKDLIAFTDFVEELAIKGKHEETGNRVSIYISDTDCDTNYSCLESKNIRLTLFRTFILNAIVSLDVEVYNEVSSWIRSLQRTSTLISVSGEKIRVSFFDMQRKLIESI